MAMKKHKVSVSKPVENETVTTKAVYALAIFCISFIGLNYLLPMFELDTYFGQLFTLFQVGAIACPIIAVASLVAWLKLRKSHIALSYGLMALAALMLLWGFTAWLLKSTYMTFSTELYVFYGCALVLYLIHLIYPTEFFLTSCGNMMAVAAFYFISQSKMIPLFTVGLLVCLVLVNGLVYMGSKHKGMVGKYKLFGSSFISTIAYGNGALLVLCLIGSLVLGSLFAYYAVFAVGAVQLVLAVYYTVKLS